MPAGRVNLGNPRLYCRRGCRTGGPELLHEATDEGRFAVLFRSQGWRVCHLRAVARPFGMVFCDTQIPPCGCDVGRNSSNRTDQRRKWVRPILTAAGRLCVYQRQERRSRFRI